MPEGPEVRRTADRLDAALAGKQIIAIAARTRAARAWLNEHPHAVQGRRIERVRARGKHLLGWIEGGYFFHAHLMMWGRWEIHPGDGDVPPDRRERARVVVPGATAVLLSAPIFDVGQGDPADGVEFLSTLGPDILPYPEDGPFNAACFLERLQSPPNRGREIGAALLDQRIAAGIGNYFRAELLFICRIDPWRRVVDLSTEELECLSRTIPALALRAYTMGGVTVTDEERARMAADPSLVYQPGREYGTHHYAFRRTNLPCLICGGPIRQLRQATPRDEDPEVRTRITYFCPTCQKTTVELGKPRRAPRRQPHERESEDDEVEPVGAVGGDQSDRPCSLPAG
jgi:endonuclease VIII